MKHANDDELILYFYGESRRAGAIDRHLGECAECAALYREIAGTLALASPPETPARDEHYGEEVWQRIRYDLPDQDHQAGWLAWLQSHPGRSVMLATAASAAIVVAAFATGDVWRSGARPPAAHSVADTGASESAGLASIERVRLAAIGDHLDQSERVLLDMSNAEGSPVDVSAQQATAASLVDANRFYREAASAAGDEEVANVLDDLERSLLDIVHGPSRLTPAELDRALVRLDAATLLFKVRVLSDELHEREITPVKPRTTL
jgi:hypothetical protein